MVIATSTPYFIPLIIIIILTGGLVWTIRQPGPKSIDLFKFVLLYALVTTSWYNLQHNPHLIMWLCNFTAILALILAFTFNQIVFDICFYFAWTGDVFTLLVFDNPVAPPLESYPLAWTGFIMKHIGPLLLTIHLIKNNHQKLSRKAFKTVILTMIIYTAGIAVYNLVFNQNILDLRWATLPLEQSFGPWPIYVIINMTIALGWFLAIFAVTKRLKIIAGN
ncbi:MAG: hypothetical protein ACE5D2_07565 [Fidelibacterota bacterium]